MSLSRRPLGLSKEFERLCPSPSLVPPEELESFLVPSEDSERTLLLFPSDATLDFTRSPLSPLFVVTIVSEDRLLLVRARRSTVVVSDDTAFGLRISEDRLPLGRSEDRERLALLSPTSDKYLDSTKVLLLLVLLLSCSLFGFAFEFGFIVPDCRRVMLFLRSADRGQGVALVLL